MKTLLIDKKDVKIGDAVFHHGDFRTVCKKDITRDPLLGICIFGDSFMTGHKKVEVLDIRKTNPLGTA